MSRIARPARCRTCRRRADHGSHLRCLARRASRLAVAR